ncbi:MAG: tyrosine--tRNA ligase [Patescibacteria group bacterium]
MKIITDEKKIEEILTRGVENVYPDRASLKKLLLSGKRIRLYCGYDPTAPALHIGHGITIRKLAEFQKLGHEVIFLYGDFTARIGDPTDKAAARKELSKAQVLKNLKGWKSQIKNLINIKKVVFKFNSQWLGKMSFTDLLKLSSNFTAQQTLARDMFKKRLSEGKDLYLHEFLYPIMQAYDSVAMDVDLEIGGNDQTFNMLAGRTLMKKMKNKEKFVLTTKLLEDPTGKKMGKSEGNMVALNDTPENMFGKVMSWPDGMIVPAFEILTDIPMEIVRKIESDMKKGVNPMNFKMQLAKEAVNVFLGARAAEKAGDNFKRVFQEKQKPLDIQTVKVEDRDGKIGVLDLFVKAGLAKSNSEMRMLIKEKAIRVDDDLIHREDLVLEIPEQGLLLQRGKKLFKRAVKK